MIGKPPLRVHTRNMPQEGVRARSAAAHVEGVEKQMSRLPLVAIVDDDLAVRQSLAGLMRALGYLAADFASAEAYLSDPRREDVDALITDLQMPGIGGIGLLRALQPLPPGMIAIVMTAFPSDANRSECLRLGARACLTKPADSGLIADLLEAALGPGRAV